MSDCKPLYCMIVAERSVRPDGLLLVMLGNEYNKQKCRLQGLMGCEAISVHWTAGIPWFWHLLMVIFSTMTKEVLIVVELCKVLQCAVVFWCL